MIVLDASALLEVLLALTAAPQIESLIFQAGETLHAPHLIDLEVTQVLRRFEASGQLSAGRGQMALDDLADFPLSRYPHAVLLPRIWTLRTKLTAYDAAYVALAEALGAVLVTCDRRLSRSRIHRARIHVVQ